MDQGKESQGSQEQLQPRVTVSLDARTIAQEIKTPNASFSLSNMFSENASLLGGDKYSHVFLRSESGNIYLMNDRGDMANGNESEKQGKVSGVKLDVKQLENEKIVVGKAFHYAPDSYTTPIVEIVATTNRQFDPEYVEKMSDGKKNTIKEELRKKLQLPEVKNTEKQETEKSRVKSFKTAKGSEYTYDYDDQGNGRTTRYKTVTGEQNARQDITVFADLDLQETQDVLHAYHHPRATDQDSHVYVFEVSDGKAPKIIRDIAEVTDPDNIGLAITKGRQTVFLKRASLQPVLGSSVFDMRHFTDEKGQEMTERHLGNKVVDIVHEDN